MRAVVQRVSHSSVTVDGKVTGEIGKGLNVLIGVEEGDTEKDADFIAEKVMGLRIFTDENDKMNLSVTDVGGSVLAISQFTLLGDARKGRRPSFAGAADPVTADRLYEYTCGYMRDRGIEVQTGVFQTHMDVSIENDGPVTILLDSRKRF